MLYSRVSLNLCICNTTVHGLWFTYLFERSDIADSHELIHHGLIVYISNEREKNQ